MEVMDAFPLITGLAVSNKAFTVAIRIQHSQCSLNYATFLWRWRQCFCSSISSEERRKSSATQTALSRYRAPSALLSTSSATARTLKTGWFDPSRLPARPVTAGDNIHQFDHRGKFYRRPHKRPGPVHGPSIPNSVTTRMWAGILGRCAAAGRGALLPPAHRTPQRKAVPSARCKSRFVPLSFSDVATGALIIIIRSMSVIQNC